MPDLRIVQADARALPLVDDSVDLVVTSPPYFALRSYRDGGEHYAGQIGDERTVDEYVGNLLDVTRECVRVLKPTGSLWVNLGDKYGPDKGLLGIPWQYAHAARHDLGLILRAEVIWSKPNGLPERVSDRVRRSHEQWFHFVQHPRYYSALDEIREPYAPDASARRSRYTAPSASRYAEDDRKDAARKTSMGLGVVENPLGRVPASVWTVPSEPLRLPADLAVAHFAAFPTEHPFRIVRGWSPEDGVVLDPFGGTGTTAHVAHALGRTGISVDASADYCRIARHPEVIAKRAEKVAKKLRAREKDGPGC